jgi:hypothetical protein
MLSHKARIMPLIHVVPLNFSSTLCVFRRNVPLEVTRKYDVNREFVLEVRIVSVGLLEEENTTASYHVLQCACFR